MARPTGKVTYWIELSQALLNEKVFTIPVLSECGITIVDDTGPVGYHARTRYVKVRDEEAPDKFEGKTVDLDFEQYHVDHYEAGHDPLVKHRVSKRMAR